MPNSHWSTLESRDYDACALCLADGGGWKAEAGKALRPGGGGEASRAEKMGLKAPVAVRPGSLDTWANRVKKFCYGTGGIARIYFRPGSLDTWANRVKTFLLRKYGDNSKELFQG